MPFTVSPSRPPDQSKGDSDAASWLPPSKAYRCRFIARLISVKYKYKVSVGRDVSAETPVDPS